MWAGFYSALTYNVVYQLLFWTLAENIKIKIYSLKYLNQSDLSVNTISGGIASFITSILTHPIEFVKTKR